MSDFNSSLPIRTENNGDVVAKIVDGTITSQALAIDSSGRVVVKLDDGAGNLITSQSNGAQRALDVGINVSGIQVDPRSIRALTSSDTVSAVQSGTWTVQPGNTANTTPWLVTDSADGSASGGTAAAKSNLSGGIFNTSLPTLTTGQQSSLQLDTSGRLIIAPLAITSVVKVDLQDGSGNSISSTANALNVNISSGSLTVGTVDKTTFTYGTTADQVVGGVFQDTSPTLTAGQGGAVRLTGNRAFHINLRDSSGNEKLGSSTSANSIPVVIASDQAHFPVELQDNAGNGLTSQTSGAQRALDVGINVSGVQVDPRSIRALTSTDVVTANVKDSSGNAFSTTNPLPVVLSQNLPGTSVNKYNTTVNLAAAGTANHVYTITTSKTFTGKKFWASGSGKIRADVQTSPDGTTYTTFWTAFNSTANPNISIDLELLSIADSGTGSTIRIVITNDDKAAFDVFSTISGVEN